MGTETLLLGRIVELLEELRIVEPLEELPLVRLVVEGLLDPFPVAADV